MFEERGEGFVAGDGAKGIFDVGGDEDVCGFGDCEGAKVVNHLVGAGGEKGTVLVRAHGFDDRGFGDIQDKAGGQLEESFEHGNGSDALARLFGQWLDKAFGPELNGFRGDVAAGPSDRPKSDGFGAVWCFEKGGEVGVAPFGNARVGSMLEGLDAFGYSSRGDF